MYQEPTNHPLIPRKNNVMIEKKQVTVHTEDRDMRMKTDGTYVETQSKFSIQLPDALENVAYVQLKNIQVPTHYINIAEKYRNNKFSLTIEDDENHATITITIQDGFYTPSTLINTLILLTTRDYGSGNNTTFIEDTIVSDSYSSFLFSNNNIDLANTTVTLSFNGLTYTEPEYCNDKKSIFLHDYNSSAKWGLGYILGFNGKTSFSISYDANGVINETSVDGVATPVVLYKAPAQIRLDYMNTIYLEVNDFNTISEIKPDSGNRNDTFNNGYSGLGDAALAKIPVPNMADGITPVYNMLSMQIMNTFSETQKLFLNSFLTRVHKLLITFRDHKGNLVDFNNQDFTFTLEFGLVREVPNRVLNILNFT
jgi:hypothetical protein